MTICEFDPMHGEAVGPIGYDGPAELNVYLCHACLDGLTLGDPVVGNDRRCGDAFLVEGGVEYWPRKPEVLRFVYARVHEAERRWRESL